MSHTVDSCAFLVKETRKLNFLASLMEKADSNSIKNPPKLEVWKVPGKEINRQVFIICLFFGEECLLEFWCEVWYLTFKNLSNYIFLVHGKWVWSWSEDNLSEMAPALHYTWFRNSKSNFLGLEAGTLSSALSCSPSIYDTYANKTLHCRLPFPIQLL